MTTAHPPAWYPAPNVPGQLRYWDGHRWTGAVAAAANHNHPVVNPFDQYVARPLTRMQRFKQWMRANQPWSVVGVALVSLAVVFGLVIGSLFAVWGSQRHSYADKSREVFVAAQVGFGGTVPNALATAPDDYLIELGEAYCENSYDRPSSTITNEVGFATGSIGASGTWSRLTDDYCVWL
jgi:Protein of unknown function (DUF2510)